MTTDVHNNLFDALTREAVRVEGLRMNLNMNRPSDVVSEFFMRRLLLRSRMALQHRNTQEAERLWRALLQVGHGSS